ncbi:MAG TPA: hypothetical protein VGO61_18435 [Steroidobacteraceae bacterium]|nr:hypothetical protein [Steroidobacteraceae bacterium]
MNYGPLEFAAYLRRKGTKNQDPAAVKAARDAAPADGPEMNRLTVVTGQSSPVRVAGVAQVEAVSVYEAVAMRAPCVPSSPGPVRVLVRPTRLPVVLVLSSHQTVRWQLTLAPGAALNAVLLSGYGESTVAGAGAAVVSSIGGFYAFKRGSAEFKHLESEVMRCTGRNIDGFQSDYAGDSFEIGQQ